LDSPKIQVNNLNLWYGSFQALKDVNASFKERLITAIIGPSGCGKSTLLRVFNRMNDLIEGVRVTGTVIVDDMNVIAPDTDLTALRQKIGMVFQRPNPFPLSIYQNVVFGPRIHGRANKNELDEIAEKRTSSSVIFPLKERADVRAPAKRNQRHEEGHTRDRRRRRGKPSQSGQGAARER
jgi:phosphate transport system ATP-binding protein